MDHKEEGVAWVQVTHIRVHKWRFSCANGSELRLGMLRPAEGLPASHEGPLRRGNVTACTCTCHVHWPSDVQERRVSFVAVCSVLTSDSRGDSSGMMSIPKFVCLVLIHSFSQELDRRADARYSPLGFRRSGVQRTAARPSK